MAHGISLLQQAPRAQRKQAGVGAALDLIVVTFRGEDRPLR